MKKALKIVGLFLLGVIIALVMVPYLFKDEIINKIKDYANQHLNAELDFSDLSISVIKTFPNAGISLKDFKIKGRDQFEDIILVTAKELSLETNLKAAFKNTSNLELKEFHITDANVNILNTKNGATNYDIFKSKDPSAPETESDFSIAIKKYSISSTDISYADLESNIFFESIDFNQTGSGDFSLNQFDLKTKNKIQSVSLESSGIPYLKNSQIEGPMDLNVDMINSKYSFKNNALKMHDLVLEFIGFVDLNDSDIEMDLGIHSQDGDIRNFLSIIPNIYYKDLPNLNTAGQATISCDLKGKFDENTYPAINIEISTTDGFISTSVLPEPIQNLNMLFKVQAVEGNWNDLEINVPNFSLTTLNKPFSGRSSIKNVFADPNINLSMNGTLDLPSIASLFSTPEVNVRSGTLTTNFSLLGNQSDFEKENYNAISFEGTAKVINLEADYYEYKNIKVNDLNLVFEPSNLAINNIAASVGNSDFNGDISIENPLAYFITDKAMTGNLKIQSNILDLRPYLQESNATTSNEKNNKKIDEAFIRNSLLHYQLDIEEVLYPDYKIEKVKSSGTLGAEKIIVNNSKISLNEQNISFQGEFGNVWNYLTKDDILNGYMKIDGPNLNLNVFNLGQEESKSSEDQTLYLPKNLNTVFIGNFDALQYMDYNLENLNGKLSLAQGVAVFEGIAGNVLDGKIKFDGIYDTSNNENDPKFDMKYDLSQFKWSNTFAAVETFRKLAPIGNFVDGLFNSTLTFSGLMGKNMIPNWNSLSAAGFIHTKDGSINGLIPLERIGTQLGIQELSSFKIEDTKNWFEVIDGLVEIKPFDFNIEDMKFTAAGNHSFDQKIDYLISAVIPRDKLKQGKIGATADQGISYLIKEASKEGINISMGDYIYLDIKLTGNLQNPKVKIIPKGSGGQATKDIVLQKTTDIKETVRDTIKKEVESAKAKAISKANEEFEKAKTKVGEEKEKLIEKGKETAKEKVGEIIDKELGSTVVDTLASKANDKLGDIIDQQKTKEEIEKMKEKLKKWDPFKKKGGGN